MATKHSKYYIFPGKQQDPVIVPITYQPVFFEGVQTFDGTSNTTDMSHGQHGSLSNVIEEKSFENITGTINVKDLGHLWPCLRALCDQDPDKSFVFDPAYLGKVDVYVNVMLKDQSKVMSSRWYADFAGSYSGSNPLDDVSTADIEYTATRLLVFEGYQIVVDTFADTQVGDESFILTYPAVVPPVMNDVVVKTPDGIVSGKQLHEYCPIEYALRVWVGGSIMVDPDSATIVTTHDPDPTDPSNPDKYLLRSRLYLKEPIAEDGQIVKVMYLVPGDVAVARTGVSKAPIMVSGLPLVTDSAGTLSWDGKLKVTLSRTATEDAMTALTADDFRLTVLDATGTTWTITPSAVDVADSVTLNSFVLDFTSGTSTGIDASGASVSGTGYTDWAASLEAHLRYEGAAIRDAEGNLTPTHSILLEAWDS